MTSALASIIIVMTFCRIIKILLRTILVRCLKVPFTTSIGFALDMTRAGKAPERAPISTIAMIAMMMNTGSLRMLMCIGVLSKRPVIGAKSRANAMEMVKDKAQSMVLSIISLIMIFFLVCTEHSAGGNLTRAVARLCYGKIDVVHYCKKQNNESYDKENVYHLAVADVQIVIVSFQLCEVQLVQWRQYDFVMVVVTFEMLPERFNKIGELVLRFRAFPFPFLLEGMSYIQLS